MLPSRIASTPRVAATSRALTDKPLYLITELREMTRRARILARWVMMSSVIPSLKYSFSGFGLPLMNGKTAIDLRDRTETVIREASAAAKAPAVAKRSEGVRAKARRIAASTVWGTVARNRRMAG